MSRREREEGEGDEESEKKVGRQRTVACRMSYVVARHHPPQGHLRPELAFLPARTSFSIFRSLEREREREVSVPLIESREVKRLERKLLFEEEEEENLLTVDSAQRNFQSRLDQIVRPRMMILIR